MEESNGPRNLSFAQWFPSNTALFIILLLVIASLGMWNFYGEHFAKTSETTITQENPIVEATPALVIVPEVTPSPVPLVDTRLTGTITENDPGCYADGICSITVGNTKVILESGGDRMMQDQVQKGLLLKNNGVTVAAISDLAVGKKVQIFGNQVDVSTVTIYGKTEYFVKLLN